MFFEASKLLGFFAAPSNVLTVLGLFGLALVFSRWRGAGMGLLAAAIVLLAVAGYSPLGRALILPLEDRFPRWDAGAEAPPDGIVVLGGAVDEALSAARGGTALTEGAERMTAAVALARRFPNARLVYSGGSNALFSPKGSEAEYAGRLWRELGIAPNRITLEDRSRNTAENAAFTKTLVNPKPDERWLLITSAYHMPRAVGLFRHEGFAVEPYPVDWRTRGPSAVGRPFGQVSDGLAAVDLAVHEWVGLVSYWATGRIAEPFPAPASAGGSRAAERKGGA